MIRCEVCGLEVRTVMRLVSMFTRPLGVGEVRSYCNECVRAGAETVDDLVDEFIRNGATNRTDLEWHEVTILEATAKRAMISEASIWARVNAPRRGE